MTQSPSNDAAHSSDDDLKKNADGSVDLYFGPQPPASGESNWLQTVPGRGFYPMFRFYTPRTACSTGRGHFRTSSPCDPRSAPRRRR
jgi:hypothetical protein